MASNLLRLSKPLNLLLAAMTYVLGTGIADYLGESISHETFWPGLLVILLAQGCMPLLGEVFRPVNEPILPAETPAARQTLRNNCLYISIAALTVLGVTAFFLFINSRLSLPGLIFLAVSVLAVFSYGVPPLRLVNRGFGEFLSALHLAFIIPSLGFLLQAEEYHRLVGLGTIPLTALALAYFLVLDFPVFGTDQKYERRTLLTMLGWQKAIPFHHTLLLVSYGVFGIAPFLGVSLQLLWPAFITLPFALLQIVFLHNISQGAHPNWTLLTVNALAVFGLTAYFLTLTFYLR